MKFALLGSSEFGAPLLGAIAADAEHEITLAVRPGNSSSSLLANVRGLRLSDDPDDVLVHEFDAAIVQGWDAEILTAARRLASNGVPVVLVPDTRQDTAYVYELTLVRDDNGVPLVPALPILAHPRIDWLRRVVRGELPTNIGPVQWLRWEREVTSPGADGFTIREIETALLGDVAHHRYVGGDFDRVTALHTSSGATHDPSGESRRERLVTGTTVTLGGADRAEVTWQLRGGETHRWRLEVVGAAGRLEVAGTDDPNRVLVTGGEPDAPEQADVGPPALAAILRAIEGDRASRPTWTDLVRDFEVVDASRRSVRRRRTIDLLFETTSERSQFKSQMAAGGCGVLLYALFALIVAAGLNTLGDLPPSWRRWAMLLLFLPVFAFLALQLLILVARPSRSPAGTDESPDGS